MNNRTFIIVIIILALVSLIGILSYLPGRNASEKEAQMADFPKEIGEWTSTDIALSERDYQILETRNLFMRDYKNIDGESVILYVVYSEDNRKVSHPPEVCYMGSGVSIVDKSPLQVTNSIKATKLVMEKADSRQLVVYWYKAGRLHTDKYLKQQLKIVFDRMFDRRTSGALIRLSTDIKDSGEKVALELIKSFCTQIEPLLTQYVP